MSLTGMNCEVKLTCAKMNIGRCKAKKMHCNNFDPEVQIEHNNQRARFTCTDNDCDEVSPTICAPETTMTTVTTSAPQCETTYTTHSCQTTTIVCNTVHEPIC